MRVLLFLLFTAPPALAFGPPTVETNNEGVRRYQNEEYNEAFKNFAGALAKDPFNPTYHFNLGDSFLKGGELPKALAEFEAVEADPKASSDLKFRAMFNAGNAAVEAKDIPKALAYYQRALEHKPDSIETKTNIELVLRDKGGGGKSDQKDKNQKGGESQEDDKQQQQDQKQDEKKEENKQGQGQQPTPTPRPTPHGFSSQALNEGDVQRILEELKRQEEQIRAKQQKDNKARKEEAVEKDW